MSDQPPLQAFIAVRAFDHDDLDEPVISAFTYPFPTREQAQHEADQMEAIADHPDAPDADWVRTEVCRLLVRPDDLEPMDADTYDALQDAANAVSAGLVAREGIVEGVGRTDE